MHIKLIGINHKTAPIEVRERFFLTPTEQDLLLSELKSHPKVCEAFVLSTCNRTEVYVHLIEKVSPEFLLKLIADIKAIDLTRDIKKHFYVHEKEEAIRHLLKVASGIDSLVVGERQILGQVKCAFERAREKAMLGKQFNILSNVAIRTGKKAQTETDISAGGSSVSWAAIVMIERLLGELKGKKFLIIGAGKMSEMAINQIHQKELAKLYIMNRTPENGEKLAQQYNAISSSFCDIKEILSEVDVCICSAGAPHYILDANTVEKIMRLRQGRKLVLVDISMPRNIDPHVAGVEGVALYMIDDLDKIVDESMRRRQASVSAVEAIIGNKVIEFYAKLQKLQVIQPEYSELP